MALEHVRVCAQVDELIAGEVGYLAASIKAVADARVGDTITQKKNPAAEALAGPFLCPLPALLACPASTCPTYSLSQNAAVGLPAVAHGCAAPPATPLPWDQFASGQWQCHDSKAHYTASVFNTNGGGLAVPCSALCSFCDGAEQYTSLSASKVSVWLLHQAHWCNSKSKAAEAAVCVWASHHLAVTLQAMFK